jgi:hypothetical protein
VKQRVVVCIATTWGAEGGMISRWQMRMWLGEMLLPGLEVVKDRARRVGRPLRSMVAARPVRTPVCQGQKGTPCNESILLSGGEMA